MGDIAITTLDDARLSLLNGCDRKVTRTAHEWNHAKALARVRSR